MTGKRKFTRTAIERHKTSLREAYIKTLAQRFYTDEQGTLVSNGLSTELICFPSDVQAHHRPLLNIKIRNALSYATQFVDVEVMNALRHVSYYNPPNEYLALGLYLYFADEFSRKRSTTTFLSAMREAGIGLKAGERFDRKSLKEKTQNALGLDESHSNILDEWYNNGRYTIQKKLHTCPPAGHPLQGAYAQLAHKISKDYTYLGMNYAISYALGNKDHVAALPAEEAYKRTEELAGLSKEAETLIKKGDHIREEKIRSTIQNTFGAVPATAATEADEAQKQARSILSILPDNVLEILYLQGYMFAYSNRPDIKQCYPADDLPGISREQNQLSRNSKATRQSRYRMFFLSNGIRSNPTELTDEVLRNMVVGEGILHESMHLVIDSLSTEERNTLRIAVEDIRKNGRFPDSHNTQLRTHDGNTLDEVMDYQSRLYTNYGKNDKNPVDTRWEEVACNCFALMHTEYAPSRQVRNTPFNDFSSLQGVSRLINEAVEKALLRSRAQFSHVMLPNHVNGK